MNEIKQALNLFAANHKLIFEDNGEVGFGRPCVGFISKGGDYVDYNPYRYNPTEEVWPHDDRLRAPPDVEAYNKHQCFAVLIYDAEHDQAIRELHYWIEKLNSIGETIVVPYETGAEGLQAVMSGMTGYALRFKDTVDEQD